MFRTKSYLSIIRSTLKLPKGITQKGFISHVLVRNLGFNYRVSTKVLGHPKLKILAMMRVRNEELLLEDSLNHVGSFADAILVLDDASVDRTASIALAHPKVVGVIRNKKWRPKHRIWEETAHRRFLLKMAGGLNPEWLFYCDADERFEGDIRKYLLNECPEQVSAIRVNLLDAYITPNDQEDFKPGNTLMNFRQFFGIERREILMFWRYSALAEFFKPDSREPTVNFGEIETRFWCQHYGKAISKQDWESTCDYYINNFPKIYQERWLSRKGKAVHTKSDFNSKLRTWEDAKRLSVLL